MADTTDLTSDTTGTYESPKTINQNPIYISGHARVHQGDVVYPPMQDVRQAFRKELQYDSMFDKTDQISMSSVPVRSFDWVWETSFKDWLKNGSSISNSGYWISGKPGSGKSTLMHYLVHGKRTRQIIRKRTKKYMVLSFFFNYRAGGDVANHQIGLIKCFLSQLCDQAPELEERLARRYCQISSEGLSEQRGLEMLRDGLKSLEMAVCAFIDGLDEYQGNHAYLADLILQLQHQSGIRICLASRPESLLVKKFDNFPTLHMHQFNGPSISKYIQDTLYIAQDTVPNIYSTINAKIQQSIVSNSQGVLIWTRLVLGRLIEEATRGASHAYLVHLLDSLPKDLEQMYDQSFLRVSVGERPQAALILWVLAESGGLCPLKRLYGLWLFLNSEFYGHLPVPNVQNVEQFQSYAKRLCNSFTEIGSAQVQRRSFWKRVPTEDEPRPWDPVRLLHKTVQPYVLSSELINAALPPYLAQIYGKSIEAVYFGVIVKISESPKSDQANFDIAAFKRDAISGKLWALQHETKDWSSSTTAKHYDSLLHEYWTSQTATWQRLLLDESLFRFRSYLDHPNFLHLTLESFQIIKSALCSPLVYSLIGEFEGDFSYRTFFWESLPNAKHYDCLDLSVAIMFGLSEYVTLCQSLRVIPSREACTWLFRHIVMIMRHVPIGDRGTRFQIAKLVWPYVLTVDFDLLLYTFGLIAKSRSKWEVNLRGSELRLFSEIVPLIQPESQLSWGWMNRSNLSDYCKKSSCEWQPSHALYRWAELVLQDKRILRSAIEVRQLSVILTFLLKLSLSVTRIDNVCDTCGCILKYIFTHPWQSEWISRAAGTVGGYDNHRQRIPDGTDCSWLLMVILFAKLGATPATNDSLQQTLDSIDKIQQSLNIRVPSVKGRDCLLLEPIQDILKHYQSQGQWPDFEPYIKKYHVDSKFVKTVSVVAINKKRLESTRSAPRDVTFGQQESIRTKGPVKNSISTAGDYTMSGELPEDPVHRELIDKIFKRPTANFL